MHAALAGVALHALLFESSEKAVALVVPWRSEYAHLRLTERQPAEKHGVRRCALLVSVPP